MFADRHTIVDNYLPSGSCMYQENEVIFIFSYIHTALAQDLFMLKRNSKTPGKPGNKVRKAFRFSIEVTHKLRSMSGREGVTMAFFLDHLINAWWDVQSNATGITLDELEGITDWGYRANSCQKYNQVRYIQQFRLDPETVEILKALAKIEKQSQAAVCEQLINDEYNRKIYE